MSQFILALSLLLCLRAASAQSYMLALESGQGFQGRKISNWHSAQATPKLDDQTFLKPGQVLRWFHNQDLAFQPPRDAGFVEFVGGDRLPGRMVSYCENPKPCLAVVGASFWNAPNQPPRPQELVYLQFVRRIQWRRTDRPWTPGALFFLDGRRVDYQGLRWRPEGVQVLTDEGILNAKFTELAELHLEPDEPQTLQQERKAWNGGRVLRIETSDGLIAAAAETTFQAMVWGAEEVDRRQFLDRVRRAQRQVDSIEALRRSAEAHYKRNLANLERSAAKQTKAAELRMKKTLDKLPPDKREAKRKQLQKTIEQAKQRYEDQKKRYRETLDRLAERRVKMLDLAKRRLEQSKRELAANEPSHASKNWLHGVHPAWSVQPLWLRFPTLRSRLSFAAHELSLTRRQPLKVVQDSILGKGLVWKTDRNVLGKTLRSGGREYGWGLGVHADNQLHFAAPKSARAFRALVGLDDSVGQSGCAQAAIYINDLTGAPIYESPLLVGAGEVYDTGELELAISPRPDGQPNRLILVVRSMHSDRPQGAAPLDIGDHVNWLEPRFLE